MQIEGLDDEDDDLYAEAEEFARDQVSQMAAGDGGDADSTFYTDESGVGTVVLDDSDFPEGFN